MANIFLFSLFSILVILKKTGYLSWLVWSSSCWHALKLRHMSIAAPQINGNSSLIRLIWTNKKLHITASPLFLGGGGGQSTDDGGFPSHVLVVQKKCPCHHGKSNQVLGYCEEIANNSFQVNGLDPDVYSRIQPSCASHFYFNPNRYELIDRSPRPGFNHTINAFCGNQLHDVHFYYFNTTLFIMVSIGHLKKSRPVHET